MPTSVRVKILGRRYTLSVEEENAERTRAVAEKVNRRMRAFQREHPEQAKLTTAIITALALAEDLRLEQEARQDHTDALDGDLQTLTGTLTSALEGLDLDEEAPPTRPEKSPADGTQA